jgi:hypothetical protein
LPTVRHVDPPLLPIRVIASTCTSTQGADPAPSWPPSSSTTEDSTQHQPETSHGAPPTEDATRLWSGATAVQLPAAQAPIGSERKRIFTESVCDYSRNHLHSHVPQPELRTMTVDEFRLLTQQTRVKNPHAPHVASWANPIREHAPQKVWAFLLQDDMDLDENVYARLARRTREEFMTRQYRQAFVSPATE